MPDIFFADRLKKDLARPLAQHVTQPKEEFFPFVTRQRTAKRAELDTLEAIILTDIGNLCANTIVRNVIQDVGGDFLNRHRYRYHLKVNGLYLPSRRKNVHRLRACIWIIDLI